MVLRGRRGPIGNAKAGSTDRDSSHGARTSKSGIYSDRGHAVSTADGALCEMESIDYLDILFPLNWIRTGPCVLQALKTY